MTEEDKAVLPIAKGWRILVEPIEIETKTKSGIILSDESVDAESYLRYVGKVVSMGNLCYTGDKFRDVDAEGNSRNPGKWCNVGDFIAHAQHAGQDLQVRMPSKDGEVVRFKIINDDDVLAVVQDPTAIKTYN